MYAIVREYCVKSIPGIPAVFHNRIIPQGQIQYFIEQMADEGESWECVAKDFKSFDEARAYRDRHYTE